MMLPTAPAKYEQDDQARLRGALNAADKQNIKKTDVFDKIMMRDTVTGEPVILTVASGALVIT